MATQKKQTRPGLLWYQLPSDLKLELIDQGAAPLPEEELAPVELAASVAADLSGSLPYDRLPEEQSRPDISIRAIKFREALAPVLHFYEKRKEAETGFVIPESLTNEILEKLPGPLVPLERVVALLSETPSNKEEDEARKKMIEADSKFATSPENDAIIYANVAKRQCAWAAVQAWARNTGRVVLYRSDDQFSMVPIEPIDLTFSRNLGRIDGSLEIDTDRLTDDQFSKLGSMPAKPWLTKLPDPWLNVHVELAGFRDFARPKHVEMSLAPSKQTATRQTSKDDLAAIDLIVRLLNLNSELSRDEAKQKLLEIGYKNGKGFQDRVWPKAREKAHLDPLAPAGRKRRKQSQQN